MEAIGTRIEFNTGRQYSDAGQPIIAVVIGHFAGQNRVLFDDVARMVRGVVIVQELSQEAIMRQYDQGHYESTWYNDPAYEKALAVQPTTTEQEDEYMSHATIARDFAAAFEQATRDDQTTYWRLKEDSPEWMTDIVRECHDGRLPNDTDYAAISEVADAIADALNFDEDMDSARAERCDGMVPVYNHDRLRWLSTHFDYVNICDEAAQDGMLSPDAGMIERIGVGMYRYYEQLWAYVMTGIEAHWQEADGQ